MERESLSNKSSNHEELLIPQFETSTETPNRYFVGLNESQSNSLRRLLKPPAGSSTSEVSSKSTFLNEAKQQDHLEPGLPRVQNMRTGNEVARTPSRKRILFDLTESPPQNNKSTCMVYGKGSKDEPFDLTVPSPQKPSKSSISSEARQPKSRGGDNRAGHPKNCLSSSSYSPSHLVSTHVYQNPRHPSHTRGEDSETTTKPSSTTISVAAQNRGASLPVRCQDSLWNNEDVFATLEDFAWTVLMS
ncbi:MAG: hypothetical protein M1831_000541 [Alyxoria varia]|nr:MAG: hypothetical protein M1831_000541 [Alyxoria varia]